MDCKFHAVESNECGQCFTAGNGCIPGARPTYTDAYAVDRQPDRMYRLHDHRHLAVPKRGILKVNIRVEKDHG